MIEYEGKKVVLRMKGNIKKNVRMDAIVFKSMFLKPMQDGTST